MWVCGIDEAGRGCLCGGLFVAGVIGRVQMLNTFGAKDSKKLSPKKRENIYQELLKAHFDEKIYLYVAQINAQEIDKNGLSWAMRHGIESVISNIGEYILKHKILQDSYEKLQITIDGNTSFHAQMPPYLLEHGVELNTLIKGDCKMVAISCASIAAKVNKDKQMLELDKLYPQYNLAKNKGYGTLEHRISIIKNGYSPHHRKSFKFSV